MVLTLLRLADHRWPEQYRAAVGAAGAGGGGTTTLHIAVPAALGAGAAAGGQRIIDRRTGREVKRLHLRPERYLPVTLAARFSTLDGSNPGQEIKNRPTPNGWGFLRENAHLLMDAAAHPVDA